MYPVAASARTKAVIPYLAALLVIYCLNDTRPLHLLIVLLLGMFVIEVCTALKQSVMLFYNLYLV